MAKIECKRVGFWIARKVLAEYREHCADRGVTVDEQVEKFLVRKLKEAGIIYR